MSASWHHFAFHGRSVGFASQGYKPQRTPSPDTPVSNVPSRKPPPAFSLTEDRLPRLPSYRLVQSFRCFPASLEDFSCTPCYFLVDFRQERWQTVFILLVYTGNFFLPAWPLITSFLSATCIIFLLLQPLFSVTVEKS